MIGFRKLKHPNIHRFYDVIKDVDRSDGKIYLVAEYYSHGSLGDTVRRLNLDHLEHNLRCKKNGDFTAIRTKGIDP